eukprot:SAG31_NODE_29138_length_400_cov_0.800664_1_plen_98_part_10
MQLCGGGAAVSLWLLLVPSSYVGAGSAEETPRRRHAGAAAAVEQLPLLCFEDPGLAEHKGVGVAVRALSSSDHSARCDKVPSFLPPFLPSSLPPFLPS